MMEGMGQKVKWTAKILTKVRDIICKKDRIISYNNNSRKIMVSFNAKQIKGFWVQYIVTKNTAQLLVRFVENHPSEKPERVVAFGSNRDIEDAFNSLNNQFNETAQKG